MLERYMTRQAIVGAGLIGYTLLGAAYGIVHTPPQGYHPNLQGKDCHTWNDDTQRITECNGGNFSFTAPLSILSNHGPYATVDNLIDHNIQFLDTISVTAGVVGAALLAEVTMRRPKTRPSVLDTLFIRRVVVAEPMIKHCYVEGIGSVPLMQEPYSYFLAPTA